MVSPGPASLQHSGLNLPGLGPFLGEGPMQGSGSDALDHASPLSPLATRASAGLPASDSTSPIRPTQRSTHHPAIPLSSCSPMFSEGLPYAKLCARLRG